MCIVLIYDFNSIFAVQHVNKIEYAVFIKKCLREFE